MDVILVPGLWLDGASWEKVVPALEEAGHRPLALTLPGMVADADRARITLADHVDAVVAEIDLCEGQVVLVGHSAGAGICHAAAGARPDRVARTIYVGGPLAGDFPAVNGEVPLPDWSAFDADDLTDLDRDAFRARAVPSPEQVVRGLRELGTPRDVEFVDLPTGHWPQLTRPDDLAQAILRAIR